jgi:hypothetical protein
MATTACDIAIARLRNILLGVRFAALLAEISHAFLTDGWSLIVQILEAALISFEFSTEEKAAVISAIACFRSLTGGSNMPCATTHSGPRVQGAGTCCAAVQSGALTPPPAGTILAPYVKGSHGAGLPAGRSTQVNIITASGNSECGTCMIVGSRSTSHPGKPVLKFIRGGPGCPTGGSGCCAMAV